MAQTSPPAALPSSTLGRVFSIWGRGTRALFGNLGTALLFAGICALVAAPLDAWIYTQLQPPGAAAGGPPDQSLLLKVGFAWMGVDLALELLLGPLAGAAAVAIARAQAQGKLVSTYNALNFGLSRYPRMVLPHLGAWLTIWVGNIVVVPGVLFMLMYAFVDPVAALEDEKWPMARSSKLTAGRRATLFFVSMPFFLYGMVRIFIDFSALGKGTVFLFGNYLFAFLFGFWCRLCFSVAYMDRQAEIEKRRAEKAAQAHQVAADGAFPKLPEA
jgi:hypothetical protein